MRGIFQTCEVADRQNIFSKYADALSASRRCICYCIQYSVWWADVERRQLSSSALASDHICSCLKNITTEH